LPEEDGIRIELQPKKREACPVVICAYQAESDGMEVFPGESGAIYELWPKMKDKLPRLRSLVCAIVGGRFEESFEPGGDPPKIIATAHTGDGPETMSRNILFRRSRKGWQHRAYRPY
jgi:hypothetical protein